MTLPTREELDRFSDTVGRVVAAADGHGSPVANRHVDRLRLIKQRAEQQRVSVSIGSEIGGRFGVACIASAG